MDRKLHHAKCLAGPAYPLLPRTPDPAEIQPDEQCDQSYEQQRNGQACHNQHHINHLLGRQVTAASRIARRGFSGWWFNDSTRHCRIPISRRKPVPHAQGANRRENVPIPAHTRGFPVDNDSGGRHRSNWLCQHCPLGCPQPEQLLHHVPRDNCQPEQAPSSSQNPSHLPAPDLTKAVTRKTAGT